jgi:hypothetical protein
MSEEVKLHPYAAAILHYLKGKKIEVNSGDVKTIFKFAESDVNQKNVIRGTLEDAMGDALIVSIEKNKKNTRIFLNVWSIKSILPIEEDLFVKDVYEDEYEGFAKNKNKKL